MNTILYPPVLMALCGLIWLLMVGSPFTPIPRWRYWLACLILVGGVGNFVIRVVYGLWRMHA